MHKNLKKLLLVISLTMFLIGGMLLLPGIASAEDYSSGDYMFVGGGSSTQISINLELDWVVENPFTRLKIM